MTKQGLLDIYSLFGWVTIGIGVGVLALSPIVKKWMHLDTLKDRDPLAGRDELAEPAAPGIRPQDETTPGPARA
jgi:POT family proton-dependent oligopeptide transporter